MIFKIKPIPKPRMVHSDRYRERPIVLRYFDYCDELRAQALRVNFFLGKELDNLIFVIPMPKSWSKKKRAELNCQPHEQKPDLDNLLKAFKDALLAEDSKVHTYNSIKKIWGYHGAILYGESVDLDPVKNS